MVYRPTLWVRASKTTKFNIMKIQLLQGNFSKKEAIEIITHMVHVKVKFQEAKMKLSNNVEDIRKSEKIIQQMHKNLYNARVIIEKQEESINLEGLINIEGYNESISKS